MLNMRNGLIRNIMSISDGTSKDHELPWFKEYVKNNKTERKTIWISDRAFIDYQSKN